MAADHTTAEGAPAADAVLGERPDAAGFAGVYDRLRARVLELDAATEDDPFEALERLFDGADEPAPTPAAIGRYEVLDRIGEGGMGVVYLARDRSLDRLLAIKLIGGSGRGSRADDRARLQREARAMARPSHPNVVTV
ncbi:MAG: serine/threonine protein kinase, partial [Myxococcales bacterium]|nr:serine/threonine protein kinase [Myxococcales bacterium]